MDFVVGDLMKVVIDLVDGFKCCWYGCVYYVVGFCCEFVVGCGWIDWDCDDD